jgi:XTP/dITP diphosphohydrolase
MQLVFATNNRHKLEEVQQILGAGFTLVTPKECGITEDIPEEQPTLEGNALQKARYIHERTGKDCFADDTGLEVEALGGAPGVRSARYAGEEKNMEACMDLLLANLAGNGNRRARFRTVIALILNEKEYLFEGIVNGSIRERRSGTEGFGYDPLFEPEGHDITFAEMDLAAKNAISHRGRAVRELAEFLKTRPVRGH